MGQDFFKGTTECFCQANTTRKNDGVAHRYSL